MICGTFFRYLWFIYPDRYIEMTNPKNGKLFIRKYKTKVYQDGSHLYLPTAAGEGNNNVSYPVIWLSLVYNPINVNRGST